jgi:O-antigen/teichoic acid export membrane protein
MSTPAMTGAIGTQDRDADSAGDLASAARSGTLGLIGAVVSALGGFALTVTVARTLGSTGAGLFFSTLAIFSIAAGVTTFGADTGLVRQLSRLVALNRLNDLRRTVVVGLVPVVGLSLLVTGLLVLLAEQVLDVVLDQDASDAAQTRTSYLWFVGLLTTGAAFTVVIQATRGLGSVRSYVGLQNVFLPVVRPLLVVAVMTLGSATWLPAAAWTLPLVPALVLAALLLVRLLRAATARADADTPATLGWRATAAEFWSFSVWRGVASVIEITIVWLDVLLVAALVGVAEAGVYAAASRFATTGAFFLQAMRLAIAPQLSGMLATGQDARAGQLYRAATTWVILASWPVYLLMAFFSWTLLSIFGSSFTEAATALTILSLAMMVNLATGNVTTVLLMAGRSRWMLLDKVASLVVMIALDVVLVPPYGITGAAVGWGAAMVVDKGLAAWQVSVRLGLSGVDAAAVKAALTAVAWFGGGAALCAALGAADVVGLLLTLGLGGLGYAATLWMWRTDFQLAPLMDLLRRRGGSTSTTRAGAQ